MRKHSDFIPHLAVLAAVVLFGACSAPSEQDYLDFLYESMPVVDSLVHSQEYWEANVSKTLEVRERMGWDIPEREFRHFVLPLRVNNEDLDDFRTVYADSLCARVEGMPMADAALEINHWCHERASYVPSDGRTLGPMSLIRSGVGRCGEESVLAVSALRAAGIPARQVYTPRWAHTDDNHAWVEVYVDGGWHFMGACEPEPLLDVAWFNGAVSRALLLHTKVFGPYDGPEDVISRTSAYTEINVIRNYVPSHCLTVTVRDTQGQPVKGAAVEFKIYNYAEFYTVARYITDDAGQAHLDTGCGSMAVWASKDDMWGLEVISDASGEVVLDKRIGVPYSLDFDVVPPAENPLPDLSTEEMKQANVARFERENVFRESLPHPRTLVPELFLADKDAIDVSQEVIDDALATTLTGDRYIDSPRVELEQLLPYRQEIRSSGIGGTLRSPDEIVEWVRDHITVDASRNPQGLRIPPVAVWRGRVADARSRNIFFVALCRTLGFAARLDEASGLPQYASAGGWITVDFDGITDASAPTGRLHTVYNQAEGAVRTPSYYTHYTIANVLDGSARLCEYSEYAPVSSDLDLIPGYYLMTSGTRLDNGNALVHIETFNIESGQDVTVPIVLRQAESGLSVIGSLDAEKKFTPSDGGDPVSILSRTGRGYFLISVSGRQDEPSTHARRQMEAIASDLNAWGRPVIILGGDAPSGVDSVILGTDEDGSIARMLLDGVDAPESVRLPYIAVADTFGHIVFFSQGYNTSLGEQLRSVLKLMQTSDSK